MPQSGLFQKKPGWIKGKKPKTYHLWENSFSGQRNKTCLDDKVKRRVCTWECTETACGAKRTSCCVKRTLLEIHRLLTNDITKNEKEKTMKNNSTVVIWYPENGKGEKKRLDILKKCCCFLPRANFCNNRLHMKFNEFNPW